MTSQWVERTWIRTGGYRRFRGEWVKEKERSKEKQAGIKKGNHAKKPRVITC